MPHRLCGVLGLLAKAQKSSLPRQAQAGQGPPSCSSDSQAWSGWGVPRRRNPLHTPTPHTRLKSQVTTVVTDSTPGFPSTLTGPLLVTGKDGGPSAGGLEAGKLWAPSPAPALPDTSLLGLHIWQQKLEPQACHLHKTTALSPKHFPICLLPARRRWVGKDY